MIKSKSHITPLLAITVLLFPAEGAAYVGPGLGAGALAVIAGILVAVGLFLFGLIYYPLKKVLRRDPPTEDTEQS